MLLHKVLRQVVSIAEPIVKKLETQVKTRTKPTTDSLVGGMAAVVVKSKAHLILENALLRQQVIVLKRQVNRPQLTVKDRSLLALLASRVQDWKNTVLLVKPETVLRWHREGFRPFWRRKSKGQARKPRISEETITLIKQMAIDNRRRGAKRIRRELMTLGIRVNKGTIRRYMWQARRQTLRSLTAARGSALHIHDFQVTRDRYVIFSDLHKGNRHPKIDDFQRNEPIYTQALLHYLNQDYRLVLSGDIEEGWKGDYRQILEAYEHTAYAAERAFADQGQRYFRTYGNHDDAWADPPKVDRFLKPMLGPVQVYPAIVLGNRIMITHGHQGDPHSDQRASLSQRVVRHIWRPLQQLTGLHQGCRASQNHTVYSSRDEHLSARAQAKRFLLIAGHTHRPMLNVDHEAIFSTHYINDGCCVHDNALTGLELEQGEIRLVKWDVFQNNIRRTMLKSADLGALLAGL